MVIRLQNGTTSTNACYVYYVFADGRKVKGIVSQGTHFTTCTLGYYDTEERVWEVLSEIKTVMYHRGTYEMPDK